MPFSFRARDFTCGTKLEHFLVLGTNLVKSLQLHDIVNGCWISIQLPGCNQLVAEEASFFGVVAVRSETHSLSLLLVGLPYVRVISSLVTTWWNLCSCKLSLVIQRPDCRPSYLEFSNKVAYFLTTVCSHFPSEIVVCKNTMPKVPPTQTFSF